MERGFIVRVWIAVWEGKHTDRENNLNDLYSVLFLDIR